MKLAKKVLSYCLRICEGCWLQAGHHVYVFCACLTHVKMRRWETLTLLLH